MTFRRRRLATDVLARILIAVIVVVAVFPIYWMISTSFKDPQTALAIPPRLFFFDPTLDNYQSLLSGQASAQGFRRPLVDRVVVPLGAPVLAVAIGSPCAYVRARIRFRRRRGTARGILSTTMSPPMVA